MPFILKMRNVSFPSREIRGGGLHGFYRRGRVTEQ